MKVNKADEFYKILERKAIYPVFQPIVNLQTGRVSGYEALSRIDRSSTTLMISDLFVIAEQLGCVWKLEKLCRNKALKAAVEKPEKVKLFLNVDGNIIQDKAFIQGFTNRKAMKAGVPASDIVFEITERSDIENYQILQQIMKHYADQGYEIALDDVGAGHSGLNRNGSIDNTKKMVLEGLSEALHVSVEWLKGETDAVSYTHLRLIACF